MDFYILTQCGSLHNLQLDYELAKKIMHLVTDTSDMPGTVTMT